MPTTEELIAQAENDTDLLIQQAEKESINQPEKERPLSFQEAVIPRTFNEPTPPRKGTGSKLLSDFISLPGRSVGGGAALLGYLAGGGKPKQAIEEAKVEMGRTKPKKTAPKFEKFMEPQSPVFTAGMVPYGGVAVKSASELGKKGLWPVIQSLVAKKALPKAVQGATQMAPATVAKQVENISEGKKVSPLEIGAMETLGAGIGVGGAAASKGFGALKDIAKSNVNIMLRPGQKGAKEGFNAETVFKENILDKDARGVMDKSRTILDNLNKEAKKIGAESTEVVNLQGLTNRVRDKFDPRMEGERYPGIIKFIDELQEAWEQVYKQPDITIPEAMAMRTRIGENASFVGKVTKPGVMPDPEASWQEDVWNAFYNELKNEIHAKTTGTGLQEINRKQSEIIPIFQSAKRRTPIEESKLKLRPMDILTMGLGATAGALQGGDVGDRGGKAILTGLALAGARRGLGSKPATEIMYKIGSKFKPTAERPLPKLNPADYPAGIPWGGKALDPNVGKAIADKLGVKFNGVQEGAGDIPPQYMFTTLDPNSYTTFMAKDLVEAQQRLQNIKKKFGGK